MTIPKVGYKHVNMREELSSYMLWFAGYYGLKAQLTEGETHICGQSVN